MMRFWIILWLWAGWMLPDANVQVRVYLDGLSRYRGTVHLYVYDRAEAFPRHPDRALRHLQFPAGTAQPLLIDLPPGEYAFSVFVDTNGNGRIDRNWLGIPSEPLALSGNPKFHFGPPRFDECRIRVGGTGQTLRMEVKEVF